MRVRFKNIPRNKDEQILDVISTHGNDFEVVAEGVRTYIIKIGTAATRIYYKWRFDVVKYRVIKHHSR